MVRKLSMLVAALALSTLLGAVQGCTCAPATVDTVQPNAVSKAVFDSSREWYIRTTVVDVPYGTGNSFMGAQGRLERVRWKIDEETLWLYRSYEHVTDSEIPSENLDVDGDGDPDNLYFGSPIAGFPIEKHFDIRRSYSRVTGQEEPVIEENTEKPWYERTFMRVDWATNVTNTIRAGGLELATYNYEENPNNIDAPVFDCADFSCDEEGEPINYIDFIQKVTVNPSARYIPGYGNYPICFFYGSQMYDCASSEIKVRYSLLAVDPSHEYEPLVYDDRWMETFGYFSTMRLKYNREYGLTESNRVWYANHHNIWGESFAKDAEGNVLLDAEGNPLPMPYTNRPIDKIAYHLNPGYPADLLPVTEEIAADWNVPFRDTVNALRFWECMNETADDVTTCETRVDPELEVYTMCRNNPSLPTDPEECRTPSYGARMGDLRFSHIWLVDVPQLASPFGYGPSAADPTSGEIISANAFVYGAVLDMASTNAADIVALINGEISPDEFIAGENVRAWVDAVNSGSSESMVGYTAGGGGSAKVYAAGGAAEMRGKMDLSWMAGYGAPTPIDATDADALAESVELKMAELTASGIMGPGVGGEQEIWNLMKESGLDSMLWSEETILAAGFDPTVPFSESLFEGISPLDVMDPGVMAELEAEKRFAGENAVDLEEFVDPAILGLAMSMKNAGASWEEIRQQLKVAIYRGVMEHEIGHTLGLRHNFEASYDAFNYLPEYWDLRVDGNVGPRHIDPETPEEIAGRIREYEYSSVMDYHARFNLDTHGIGLYDKAAVKFGYGKVVEILPNIPAGNFPGVGNLSLADTVGLIGAYNEVSAPAPIVGLSDGSYLPIHYTDYPTYFGDLSDRIDVPFDMLTPNSITVAAVVNAGERNMDFTDSLELERTIPGVATAGAPAVPYRFCGDEFAVGIGCARYDGGADPVEVHRSIFEGYWEYYLISNFRRDRYGFNVGGYLNRVYGRAFQPIGIWLRYYVLWNWILGAATNEGAQAFFASDRGFGPFTVAIEEGFRFLEQVIHQPEPGTYVNYSTDFGDPIFSLASYTPGLDYTGYEERNVELVEGKYYSSTWDFDAGYHWFDKMTRVGSFYDKWMALQTVAFASSNYGFIGRDTAVDNRAYSIGYNRLYRDQLSRIFGSLMSADPAIYSPVKVGASLVYPDPTDVTEVWPPVGMTAEPIQSGAYYYIQYLGAMYAMAFLPTAFDNQFLDAARIYVAGTGSTVTAPPGQATVSFTDPISGKTYVAWSYPARSKTGEILYDELGSTIELGAGARMLNNANRLVAFYTLAEAHPRYDVTTPEGAAEQVLFFDVQIREMVDTIERFINMYEVFEGRF